MPTIHPRSAAPYVLGGVLLAALAAGTWWIQRPVPPTNAGRSPTKEDAPAMTRHLLVTLALVSAAALAPAQAPSEGAVAGTGTAVLKRPPELLRMHIELTAKGKDLKEALARLKECREAARLQLTTLGAAKDSVEFGELALVNEKTDRQRQMEMMVRERVRGGGGKKPGKPAPEPVVVSATLRADWPLKAADPEELMLTAHALQEKIKAADLAGLKEAKPLTPQEEELAEEMAVLGQMRPDMMNEPKRGEPSFLFVARVPEAEYAKLLAEAFQQARTEAGRLAQAAGAALGPLRQLSHAPQAASGPDYSYAYEAYGYGYPSRMRAAADAETRPNEAVGLQPGKVTLRLTITASFALQPVK